MLILTRRVSEALVINEDITITVLSIKGNQVRLGIDAPKDIPIDREEIHYLKKQGLPKPTKPEGTCRAFVENLMGN